MFDPIAAMHTQPPPREDREAKRKSTGGNLTCIAHALLTRTGYFGTAFDNLKNEGRSMKHCTCCSLPDAGRRSFFASAASAVAAAGVVATSAMTAEPAQAKPAPKGGQR